LPQEFFHPFAFCHIVEAIDRTPDFASLVHQRSNTHDDNHPRAIRPLDMHFRVMDSGHLASQNVAHGTFLMWQIAAVWAVQLKRAAESLIGIPWRGFAAPQLRCAVVVFLDDTRAVTAIDGDGDEVAQGAMMVPLAFGRC
jgi:hypothetical protein